MLGLQAKIYDKILINDVTQTINKINIKNNNGAKIDTVMLLMLKDAEGLVRQRQYIAPLTI
jgi:hypothetical protein